MARTPSKSPRSSASKPNVAKSAATKAPATKPAPVGAASTTSEAAKRSKIPAPVSKRGAGAPATAANLSASEAVTGPDLKKQELLQKVVDKSGIKKKDAKPVVEAMLEVLGEALADGREFNLQPMGKLKLNRTKETPNARIIVAKIRQSKRAGGGGMGPKDTVAAAAE